MHSLQAPQLQAASVTLTAHGPPIIPYIGSVAAPPTFRSGNVEGAKIDVVTTILNVVKEVSEMLSDVPYVSGISNVLLEIIKIREVRK